MVFEWGWGLFEIQVQVVTPDQCCMSFGRHHWEGGDGPAAGRLPGVCRTLEEHECVAADPELSVTLSLTSGSVELVDQ